MARRSLPLLLLLALVADDLARLLHGVVADRRADALFVYHLRSWRLPDDEAFFGGFGLLCAGGTRKASWSVFRRAQALAGRGSK